MRTHAHLVARPTLHGGPAVPRMAAAPQASAHLASPPPHLPQSTHPHTHHPPPPSPPPQGICTLRYKGPKPIGYGLRAAVRDKYPDIIEVLMLDADTEEPIKF